jgi:parallel beta-helix repeat protein
MNRLKKAIGIFIIAAIVAIAALTLTSGFASAAKHVVNQTDPACDTEGDYYYTSIQAAVWNASSGDTIIVCPGSYNETVTVNKSNIVITAFNETKPIVSAVSNPNDHVVNITDQINVTLQGFEIRDANGTSKDVAGIYMNNASECNISNTIVTNISATDNDAYGIRLYYSSNNTFSSSTAVSNITATTDNAYGIRLEESSNNTFSSSTSVSNVNGDYNANGIDLDESSNNRFSSSTAVSNITATYAYGIWLYSSSNNNFSASTSVSNITGNRDAYGISLYWCSSNNRFSSSTAVSTITATNRQAYGIDLDDSSNNRFSSSTSVSNITGNRDAYGIRLSNSSNNRFNSSTSVSSITGGNYTYGIRLYYSSNNTFSSSTSVSNITATTDNAYGIRLEESSNNRFNSSTSVSNITGNGYANGISLWSNSGYNTFTGITITPTLTGAEFYEFFSEADCDENVVTDMTIGNSPTTISFTYGNGIRIKRVNVSERPGDPANYRNISTYINASNFTANSWLFVNFSYNESDVYDAEITEGTLKVWKYNGAWNEDGWNESRVLDTANNVVGVNITDFSIFTPLGTPVTSVTILTATGTGNVKINTSSGYFCDVAALDASYFLGNVPDSPVTFFHGFFNLSICGLNDTIPENVTVNFTFPSPIPTDAEFWKYNASNGTWYRYDFGDKDGDNVISINITDNGPGDHNPVLGIIEDPNGIGWLPPAVPPVPAVTPIGLGALMGLLSVIAVLTISTKRKRR